MDFCGFAQLEPERKKLEKDTYFDLASLTKPLTTVLLLLALFEKKILTGSSRLGDIFPSCPPDKRDISITQLMSHSGGFVPHRDYFKELIKMEEGKRKDYLLNTILAEKLTSLPGENHCYSDIGYILLGLIIEERTGEGIATLSDSLLYRPLRLHNQLFFPGLDGRQGAGYASTEVCPWSKKMLCGTVHDDNCRAMGGVAGHAGLFGTLEGVVTLCEQLLDQWKGRGGHPAYSNPQLIRALQRVGNSNWTMGFDMVSREDSSAGSHFSRESIGHLGFTGTSFWIDPQKECIAVLLTNRVHPSRENWKIKEFRPLFHDILMEEFLLSHR
ncbi:MAG: serine hydrolase [Thermodesulfobacteriota bacterium]